MENKEPYKMLIVRKRKNEDDGKRRKRRRGGWREVEEGKRGEGGRIEPMYHEQIG